jgi:hypothetical protein
MYKFGRTGSQHEPLLMTVMEMATLLHIGRTAA